MLKGEGNEDCKKINKSNGQKKSKFARSTHFFVHFFAVVMHRLKRETS